MGVVIWARFFFHIVTTAAMSPPIDPTKIHGVTAAAPDVNDAFHVHMEVAHDFVEFIDKVTIGHTDAESECQLRRR